MSAPGERIPKEDKTFRVGVVVAHPDDETLWAGGLILSHPEWTPYIVTLCRGEDPDRVPKFEKALICLGSEGVMGNLDDGPDQYPLSTQRVQDTILSLLPGWEFDILLTHAPQGEYTWHRRHGEVSLAVGGLWGEGRIRAKSMWQFAYEDGGGDYPPQPQRSTSFELPLSDPVWRRKYGIITDIYGFEEASWEARATTHTEAFNCFHEREAMHWSSGSGRPESR